MIDGAWDCAVSTPLGVQKTILTFKKEGMRLTGQGTTPTGDAVPLRDIAIDGNKVSWMVSVNKPMKLDVKVSITVSGTAATGKAKFGLFGSGQVTMTKR